jgi:hypothetical protein
MASTSRKFYFFLSPFFTHFVFIAIEAPIVSDNPIEMFAGLHMSECQCLIPGQVLTNQWLSGLRRALHSSGPHLLRKRRA